MNKHRYPQFTAGYDVTPYLRRPAPQPARRTTTTRMAITLVIVSAAAYLAAIALSGPLGAG